MTMATVAQVRGIGTKHPETKDFWLHRGRAISLLNKSLSVPETRVTDAMICTVGMLAYTDVSLILDKFFIDQCITK